MVSVWGVIEQHKLEYRKNITLRCINVEEGNHIKAQEKIILDKSYCEQGIYLHTIIVDVLCEKGVDHVSSLKVLHINNIIHYHHL